MTDHDEFIKRLRDMLTEREVNGPNATDFFILPHAYRPHFRYDPDKRTWQGVGPAAPDIPEELLRFSAFIPEGKAYRIKRDVMPKFTVEYPEFPQKAFDDLNEALWFAARAIAGFTESFYGFPKPRPWTDPTKVSTDYAWQRWAWESLTEWGSRLQKRGLLDDPAIRWAYQQAVMGRLPEIARQFALTVKDRLYEVIEMRLR